MIATYALMLALAAGPRPGPDETPLAPHLEERVLRIGKEIRCATCQGLSIADSPAPMARSQLAVTREMVAQGKTDEEIRAFFVARYGDWVLLDPPVSGLNWLAWLGPALFLVGGVVVIARTAFGKTPRPPPGPTPPASATAGPPSKAARPGAEEEEDAEYLARIQKELGS
jgi:cytochrome c-type biogenesis protein CcmH